MLLVSVIHYRTDLNCPASHNSFTSSNAVIKDFQKKDWFLEADDITRRYLDNSALSQKDKLFNLWKIAQYYQNDKEKFSYLIDRLSLNQPQAYIIIPEYIKFYQQQSSSINKKKLLFGIAEASMTDSKDLKIFDKNKKNIIFNAQDFIINVLQNENQPDILSQALFSSVCLVLASNEENYMIINKAIDRLEKLTHYSEKIDQKIDMLRLFFILASHELQKTQLSLILNNA